MNTYKLGVLKTSKTQQTNKLTCCHILTNYVSGPQPEVHRSAAITCVHHFWGASKIDGVRGISQSTTIPGNANVSDCNHGLYLNATDGDASMWLTCSGQLMHSNSSPSRKQLDKAKTMRKRYEVSRRSPERGPRRQGKQEYVIVRRGVCVQLGSIPQHLNQRLEPSLLAQHSCDVASPRWFWAATCVVPWQPI